MCDIGATEDNDCNYEATCTADVLMDIGEHLGQIGKRLMINDAEIIGLIGLLASCVGCLRRDAVRYARD